MATKINNGRIGVILLAGGASKRLGRPKQLLTVGNETLLQRGIRTAHASNASPVIAVLGANADEMKDKMLADTIVVVNENWSEGMASSIRCGINALLQTDPSVEGAVLMMCDQPYVDSRVLNNLIAAYQICGKPIIASSYNNTFGPPALFQKTLFPELLQLHGDTGARSVIKQHADEVEVISFPKGEIDIDTEADYENLYKLMSEQ
jgi:molybdenum cofactor cytidylyltransferase